MRHKFRFIDLAAVAVVTSFVLYLGLTTNIFSDAPGGSQKAETLELDELLLVCGVMAVGLVWAFGRLLRERQEAARRNAAEREIRTLAFHDPLTGLPNRRQLDDAIKAAAASPPRADASHGVLLLDLNGFKKINDVFGHAVGNEVLIYVGGRLSKAVRTGDMVARLGGDEFAVLATHIGGPEAATGLALRISVFTSQLARSACPTSPFSTIWPPESTHLRAAISVNQICSPIPLLGRCSRNVRNGSSLSSSTE